MAKILCVDDEPHLLDDITDIMQTYGHQTYKASDGRKAIQMVLHLKPDLVISDVSMPGLGGLDLLTEIREKHPEHDEMPIILLSAHAEKKDVLRGLDLGADDYLTKPVDYDLLAQKVRSLLRQIERIKKKNEAELVKLVDSLSDNNDQVEQASISPPPVPEMKQEAPKESPKDIPANDLDWRASEKTEEKETKIIYGATLNIKDTSSHENCKKQGIISWVADVATDFVKQLFPGDGAVTVNPNGGIYVCYEDADQDTAASRTKEITSKVEKNLKDKSVPKPFSEEEILELTIVAEAPYQTEVNKKDLKKAGGFQAAIQKKVQELPKIEDAGDLMALIEQAHGDLVLHKLHNIKGQVMPIIFFNFNEAARKHISLGFTQFDQRELEAAAYKIDCMFLSLLGNNIAFLLPSDIAIVDVHYTTLIKPEYQRLYIPKLKEFSREKKVKLLLNIRGVTKAAKSKAFSEVLKPLSNVSKGCTIQIAPEEFEAYLQAHLPVSGIVCSYLQTDWNEFSPDLVKKARDTLTDARIPMIVRGVPSFKKAERLYQLGFDGCGIDEG